MLLNIGQRFGKLTVQGILGRDSHYHYSVSVKCDCGNNKVVKHTNLNNGTTKSCGCVKNRLSSERLKKEPGINAFNSLYRCYYFSAKDRNLEFPLTKLEFRKITQSPCYYCGIEPLQIMKGDKFKNGNYKHNGIDREDNTMGYTVLNSLPCCSVCNFMKMKLGKEMFVSQCRRIVNNLNKEVS